MMRLLTGADASDPNPDDFVFEPDSIDAFGPTVLAERADPARSLYWVHVWTVGPDGVITHVREYFNTDLTVTRLEPPHQPDPSPSSSAKKKSPPTSHYCARAPLWQSKLSDTARKSLPGLVLAI
ncbi:Wound-induced protein 1 [Ananas comosus]|uniref:Wound-induced protein 1 n=1 Tax=Ananas comosus TaxID=4615 RepID=A0A199VPK4_ANACO|nr:Wound-induced protein 1 [Ananas comosus]